MLGIFDLGQKKNQPQEHERVFFAFAQSSRLLERLEIGLGDGLHDRELVIS